MTTLRFFAVLLLLSLVGGCASKMDPALEKQRQLQIQRMQTKTFNGNDKKTVIRGVVVTFQDLDFIIKTLDTAQGIVVAKKFGSYPIDMSVTIQAKSNTNMLVHGVAQNDHKMIEDPFLYEQFFSSLQKFLSASSHSNN